MPSDIRLRDDDVIIEATILELEKPTDGTQPPTISLKDTAGRRVLLAGGAEPARVEVGSTEGVPGVLLLWSGDSTPGVVLSGSDGQGRFRGLTIANGQNKTVFRVSDTRETATLSLGGLESSQGSGPNGRLILKDGKDRNRLELNANLSSIEVTPTRGRATLSLRRSDKRQGTKVRSDGISLTNAKQREVISLDGQRAELRLGGNGADQEDRQVPGGSNGKLVIRDSQNRRRGELNAQHASLTLSPRQGKAQILVERPNGQRGAKITSDSMAFTNKNEHEVVRIHGTGASVHIGGASADESGNPRAGGSSGSLVVWTADDQATISLRGDDGCAEFRRLRVVNANKRTFVSASADGGKGELRVGGTDRGPGGKLEEGGADGRLELRTGKNEPTIALDGADGVGSFQGLRVARQTAPGKDFDVAATLERMQEQIKRLEATVNELRRR